MLPALRVPKVLLMGAVSIGVALAQSQSTQSQSGELPHFGIALSVGTLGPGVQVATGLASKLNLRGGFNYFSYSLSGTTNDNLGYSGTLKLESGEVVLDYYPWKPFHISGGALIYNGFQGTGTVNVPGGHTLTLNDVTYYSSPTDPVNGTGKITVQKSAPLVMIGFGNLLPRSQRHFSANFDLGVAFQGSPKTALNLTGSTCATATTGCAPISSQPSVQANIAAEQNKITNDLKPFKFYPVISVSFGYKF